MILSLLLVMQFNLLVYFLRSLGLDPGDVWTGSEGGAIRLWPWESVEKSLGLSSEEKRMAALLVERSVIDLRAQVTVNGVCNISSSDVKYMLSDNVRAKVWAAGSQSFSLWYVVFNFHILFSTLMAKNTKI